jgi:hypothetical protein
MRAPAPMWAPWPRVQTCEGLTTPPPSPPPSMHTHASDAAVKAVRRVHPHSAAVLRSAMGSFGSSGSLGVG